MVVVNIILKKKKIQKISTETCLKKKKEAKKQAKRVSKEPLSRKK